MHAALESKPGGRRAVENRLSQAVASAEGNSSGERVMTHIEISKMVLQQLTDHQQAYVAGFADDTE